MVAAVIVVLLVVGVSTAVRDHGLNTSVVPDHDALIAPEPMSDDDGAFCDRLASVVTAGRTPTDVGEASVDPFPVPIRDISVEVIEPVYDTSSLTEPSMSDFDAIEPAPHRTLLAVGHLDRDLDQFAAYVEAEAYRMGWEEAGRGEARMGSALGRETTTALSLSYQTPNGLMTVRALACGHAGYLTYQQQPLRPSRLPPCLDPAVHDRCVELEALAEATIGIPTEIEVLPTGDLRTTIVRGPAVVLPVGSSSLVVGFEQEGWTWEERAACPDTSLAQIMDELPVQLLDRRSVPPECIGIGPFPNAPPVVHFTRSVNDRVYRAEVVTTSESDGMASMVATFTGPG